MKKENFLSATFWVGFAWQIDGPYFSKKAMSDHADSRNDKAFEQRAENLRFRLLRYDKQITVEFDLISHRMTWLMNSQSFLFSAFAICVVSTSVHPLPVIATLEAIIPVLAVVSASLAFFAIQAAHQVIVLLKEGRESLEDVGRDVFFDDVSVPVNSLHHRRGSLPSKILPLVLAAIWVLLFVRLYVK